MATQTNPMYPIAALLSEVVAHKGIERVLGSLRRHLGMDVAFVSHFQGNKRVFQSVDAVDNAPIKTGMEMPIDEGYCLKVVEGRLPQLIPNAAADPDASQIPATAAIPIGSHLSVPIELEDGTIYGTLCCFSYLPDLSLGKRDLQMMKAFSEVIAERVDELVRARRDQEVRAEQIRETILAGDPQIVYQPIFNARTLRWEGAEALSRFANHPHPTPDHWFRTAHDVSMGEELELHAIANALTAMDRLPIGVYLAVNSSPELLTSGRLWTGISALDLSRLVIEITEHASIQDYEAVEKALAPFRSKGVKIAVDDAGAGYASMRHILHLKPHIIKLDMSITRDIDQDPSRRALARGLISFANEIQAKVIAEGVETQSELETLVSIGVDYIQGYHMGKPVPLNQLLQLDEYND